MEVATAQRLDFPERLNEVPFTMRAERGAVLCRERDYDDTMLMLDKGFCIAVKRTAEGQQQNVAFYVSGDMLNHDAFTLGATTLTIIALTPVVVRRVPHARVRAVLDQDEGFARDFWRSVALQGVFAHEWILGMGRRSAYERTAHFLCEMVTRMRPAGGSTYSCDFPMTQTELADLLGLSIVHVNRMLQRLRQDRLIALRRGTLQILDWPRLATLAGFDPFYLTLVDGA